MLGGSSPRFGESTGAWGCALERGGGLKGKENMVLRKHAYIRENIKFFVSTARQAGLHIRKQAAVQAAQAAAGEQTLCCPRKVISSYTPLALPGRGCNSAQHFCTSLEVSHVMD